MSLMNTNLIFYARQEYFCMYNSNIINKRRQNRAMPNIADTKTIGKRIKAIRKKNNLSQEEFAHRIHTSQSNLSKMENGKINELSVDSLLLIAKEFDISIEYLFTAKENNILQLLEKHISFEYDNLSTSKTNTYHYPKFKISKSFYDYLASSAKAKCENGIPDNVRESWINQVKEDFNKNIKSSEETGFVEFIPVPIELIFPDDNKASWNQEDLIREINNNWNNNY